MTKRVKNNQDKGTSSKEASSKGTSPKREKKAARKRKAELDRLQVEHQDLLDRVARARAKLDKRTQKLAVLEARMAELEKQNYLPEAEPLGQADAGKHGARRARLILDPRAAPEVANSQQMAGLIRTLRGHGIAAEAGVAAGETVEQLARQAAEQGQGLLVVAGDDESIESAAQQLCGTRTTLGVIPLGSENRLIRALGIPMHTGPSAALIGTGVTRPLDLMEVAGQSNGSQYFLQSAGIGFGTFAGAGEPASNQTVLGVRDLGLRDTRVLIEDAGGEEIEATNQVVIFSNAPLLGVERPGGPDWKID
ncbi:MAG: diacylglycerol/lipid kinase family protein, partial [Rudaea sp.]